MTAENQASDGSIATWDLVVVGAGIAGLTCAEQLRQAGYSVVVVEKSRGFGGRAATKRLPDFRADHGLQYLKRSGRLLPGLVDSLRDRGVLVPWNARFGDILADGTLKLKTPATPPTAVDPVREVIGTNSAENPENISKNTSDSTRYIAPAGANAIGKHLAQNLTVWRSRRAVSLATKGDRWHVQLEAVADGVDAPLSVTARTLAIAIPAPQAADLLATHPAIAPEIQTAIAAVDYHPCLTAMVGYPPVVGEVDRDWDALQIEGDDALSWAGVESTKREAQRLMLTLHSTPQFAVDNFDAPDLEAVGQALLDRLARYLPAIANTSPEFVKVHRWRYSFVKTPCTQDCLSTRSPLPLVLGGDWCGTAFAESALGSGLAMATAVSRSLDGRSLPTLSEILADLS